LNAIEQEIQRIKDIGLFELKYNLTGTPIYMTAQKELIIFRIIQEAFNNIIKHSSATVTTLCINYTDKEIQIIIRDNGTGFNQKKSLGKNEAGINNMANRAKILDGSMSILRVPGKGTLLSFLIPIKNEED